MEGLFFGINLDGLLDVEREIILLNGEGKGELDVILNSLFFLEFIGDIGRAGITLFKLSFGLSIDGDGLEGLLILNLCVNTELSSFCIAYFED